MQKNQRKDLLKIHKKLSELLNDHRYAHTICVANTCCCLAMKWGLDIDKAYLAGLLHDCAKYMSDDEMLKYAVKNNIEISEIEHKKPDLLHAKVGSSLAHSKYNVDDKDILDAIKCHTTGKPAMTDFEKILYIADYISYGRDKMPRLDEIRRISFEDMDKALKMILDDSVKYLKSSGMPLDETTLKTYEYYDNRVKSQTTRAACRPVEE